MNDQKDIDSINQRLYNLEVPIDPIKKIMFYFTVLHDVIDYPFPANYMNYENPYFKTYSEMQNFLALAVALKPENLHTNNVIIYYNKKSYYKPDQANEHYEFRVINPNEASDSKFDKNYQNSYNIRNINSKEKQFKIKINDDIQYPHSEDSSSAPEDYYYNEGLEAIYLQDENNPYNSSNTNLTRSQYQEFRKKYNEKIVKNNEKRKSKSYLYNNQMPSKVDNVDEIEEEEEDNDEMNGIVHETVVVKLNIVNKLVVSKNWIDFIYNDPMKKNLINMKHVITNEDEVRVKSLSLPKNIFFFMIIGLLIVLLSCAAVIINSATSLNGDPRFINYEGGKNRDDNLDIIPCKKCYRKIRDGNILSIISGSFAIFFIVFIFCLYLIVSCAAKRENKKKYHRRKKKGRNCGLNMIYIIAFTLLTIIAIIISFIAEIFIIISVTQKTYSFIHSGPVLQIIMNSIIFVCYILIIIFYFKQ